MAETALFSLACKILGTLAIPAYKELESISNAGKELEELKKTIETLQAILPNVEKQQEEHPGFKSGLDRLKTELYKADDLFDSVATQQNRMKYFKKVQILVSGFSIAKKVKEIRKCLAHIYADLNAVNLVKTDLVIGSSRGVETGSFVDSKEIFGRDDDKKSILGFLYDESCPENCASQIAVVGIGGMGKSVLAKLVYTDGEVEKNFKKRWWICISDIFDKKEIIGKIYQSITGMNCQDQTLDRLETVIRECLTEEEKFLIVLDDLWDENNSRVHEWLGLLRSDVAKGSKIIITTRSSAVAEAMKAEKVHELKGLSDDASWELFKRFAFTREQADNTEWDVLGRKVMEKCLNVPLVIKSIASLLNREKDRNSWISLIEKDLSEIASRDETISVIMSTLKLSYNYLPTNSLRMCFAYCSLFHKGSILNKKDLIYLWIAQGYVKPTGFHETLEKAGDDCFKELIRRSLFEEVNSDDGDIVGCQMHDLIHDLAKWVADKESVLVMDWSTEFDVNEIRHVNVDCKSDKSWIVPQPLLKATHIRSFLISPWNCPGPLVLTEQIMKFKSLRALNLEGLELKEIPSSIEKLKSLRYLNLSGNKELKMLPNSITKLVKLLTLDIRSCWELKVWPKDFRKLTSLRHLDISGCKELKKMPSRLRELTSLQYLSDFKVNKKEDSGEDDGLDALVGLNLQGQLTIFYDPNGGWSEDELMLKPGQISETMQVLSIHHYPNKRIPVWWKEPIPQLFSLASLNLTGCLKVKYLPPFRVIPFLRSLVLDDFRDLEYIEDEDQDQDQEQEENIVAATQFFPYLKLLELIDCPKLEGWSRRKEDHLKQSSFRFLSKLHLSRCNRLKSIPSSPLLEKLQLSSVKEEMIHQLVSTSVSLQDITITACKSLKMFPGEGLNSLHKLEFRGCLALESVELASFALKEVTILSCPKLKLWDDGEENKGVSWGSVANLQYLSLSEIPESDKLPSCLARRKQLGELQISRSKLL